MPLTAPFQTALKERIEPSMTEPPPKRFTAFVWRPPFRVFQARLVDVIDRVMKLLEPVAATPDTPFPLKAEGVETLEFVLERRDFGPIADEAPSQSV